MSKRTLAIFIVVSVAAVGVYVAYRVFSSRGLSPPATAVYNYNGLEIKVHYSRPSKRGRVIFGDASTGALQPNGKYWRLGANEATEIIFNTDVSFAGKPVDAGRYRMYATLGDSTWVISLNRELDTWGANEPDYDLDIAKVTIPVETVSTVTELFTIHFDEDSTVARMHFAWDNRHAVVPINIR